MELIKERKNIRIDYFDILRGIGIIYMVLGHVYFGPMFDKYIHAFHMPIFFFVAGFFYNCDKYKSTKMYIFHDLKTLIVPYTVFVIICQILHYIYTGDFQLSYFLLSYISSNNNRIDVAGAYWFLLCLFTAKLIYYVIQKTIKSDGLKTLAVIAITLIGNLTQIELLFCLESAMSSLAFIHIGYLIKKHNQKVRKIFELPCLPVIILLVINAGLIFINGDINIRTNKYSNIMLFWLNSLSAIVLYTNLAKRINESRIKIINCVSACLKYIGRNSITFLLINEITIYGVRVVLSFLNLYNVNEVSYGMHYILEIIVFILTMIVISIFNEIVSNSKIKFILGK